MARISHQLEKIDCRFTLISLVPADCLLIQPEDVAKTGYYGSMRSNFLVQTPNSKPATAHSQAATWQAVKTGRHDRHRG